MKYLCEVLGGSRAYGLDSCQFFYVLLQAIKTTCETRGTIGSLLEDINLHIHIVMFLIEHQ